MTVSYATADGTALAGQDYTPVSGTLSFGVNETTRSITIPILTDSLEEGDETFSVTLANPTGGATLGATSTMTVTILDTTHGGAPSSANNDDEDDEPKETEDEKRQRERTNTGGKDDEYTEGNVVEVHPDAEPPYVLIGNRDGLVRVVLSCGDDCPSIEVGDYLEADGEKIHEQLFHADTVEVTGR